MPPETSGIYHERIIDLREHLGPPYAEFEEDLKEYVLSRGNHKALILAGETGIGKTGLAGAIVKKAKTWSDDLIVLHWTLGTGLDLTRQLTEPSILYSKQGYVLDEEYFNASTNIALMGSTPRVLFPLVKKLHILDCVGYTSSRTAAGDMLGVDRDFQLIEILAAEGAMGLTLVGKPNRNEQALETREGIDNIPYNKLLDYLHRRGIYPDESDPAALVESFGRKTGNRPTWLQQVAARNRVMAAKIVRRELPQPEGFHVNGPDDFDLHPDATYAYVKDKYAPHWMEVTGIRRGPVLENINVDRRTGIYEYRGLLKEHYLPRQMETLALAELERARRHIAAFTDDETNHRTLVEAHAINRALYILRKLAQLGIIPEKHGPSDQQWGSWIKEQLEQRRRLNQDPNNDQPSIWIDM